MTRRVPLQDTSFSLDSSGVAGFFGGDVAVQAMATVHVYEGRKWRGWYNSPGSYEIAKQYGRLGATRFWDGLYPGPNVDPAVLFGLDGGDGPRYIASRSGTVMAKTGHLAYLFSQECKDLKPVIVKGRRTTPVGVTVAELHYDPPKHQNPRLLRTWSSLLASIPTIVSFGTAAACGYFRDWFCFSMILLGIVSSGLSCLVLGSGKFTFSHPIPAEGAPDGDGFLEVDNDFIILLGTESAVNSITRGRFALRFKSEPQYHNIGLCSVLLTIQFLAQLLLIPQGTLFGQIMFLASLTASWLYNSYLASLDLEQVQRDILVKEVLKLGEPSMRKFQLGTRTAAVVFALLVLKPSNLEEQLENLIPNKTPVWAKWREVVAGKIEKDEPLEFDLIDRNPEIGLTKKDMTLLNTLYTDAEEAFAGYARHIQGRGYDERTIT